MWQQHKCLPYFGTDLYCQDNIISATISKLLFCSQADIWLILPTRQNKKYDIQKHYNVNHVLRWLN